LTNIVGAHQFASDCSGSERHSAGRPFWISAFIGLADERSEVADVLRHMKTADFAFVFRVVGILTNSATQESNLDRNPT
jgi:hypothetical protein